jgi:glycerol kinase
MILGDGGATANRFLMQSVADICELDLGASDVAELSALGAAWSGMLGAGLQPSVEAVAELPRATTHYRPQMDAARAARLYDGWRNAVRRVL